MLHLPIFTEYDIANLNNGSSDKQSLRFWRFLKNCCKVAKLKDDIIKHRLNPIASIKTLLKHQLRVNKGHMHNGRANNRVSVYQTKIRIGD